VDLDHFISAFMFDALMDLTVGAQLNSVAEPKYFEAWMTILSWIIWNFSIGGVPYWKLHKTAFRKKYEEADALVIEKLSTVLVWFHKNKDPGVDDGEHSETSTRAGF
jgi:hypothetical protein